jgi:lipid A 4'-phosphatase
MINHYLVKISIIVSILLSLILVIAPELDLKITDLFYYPNQGFIYKDQFLTSLFYHIIPIVTKLFITICLACLAYLIFRYYLPRRTVINQGYRTIVRSTVFYLVITAGIGPGLIVNQIFKEYYGRARPNQIMEFQGQKHFTPAWHITNHCHHNCSFTSGHAAMGYYFTALAYVIPTYFTRLYLAMLAFGSLVGLSRIVAGGHFASDVIASGIIVLLVNHVTYLLWQRYGSTKHQINHQIRR